MRKFIFLFFIFIICFNGCKTDKNSILSEKLNYLMEKEEVLNTVNQLFISTDNRDWEKVKEVFTVNVLFDMTSLSGGKPVTISSQEIVDSWDKGLKLFNAIHHQTGNYFVEINGEKATVFCYGIGTHYLPTTTNQNTRSFIGSYDFELIKEKEIWKISQFKFNLKYIDGNMNLEKERLE